MPSWASAWEADKALHQKVQTLHEVQRPGFQPAFTEIGKGRRIFLGDGRTEVGRLEEVGIWMILRQDLQSAIGAQHEASWSGPIATEGGALE